MNDNDTSFIRRHDLMENLWKASRRLDEHRFQVCLIDGEPGTGKTTLVNMFMKEMADAKENTLIAAGFCNLPSEYNLPYKPFKEMLKLLFQKTQEVREAEKSSGKERFKNAMAFSARALLKYGPDLIGSLLPAAGFLKDISQYIIEETSLTECLRRKTQEVPEQLSETKIIEQFIEFIKALAGEYSLILFIDDLQWIDSSSINLLYQMLIELKHSPVLFIGCYRSTDIGTSWNNRHPLEKLLNEVKINYGNVFVHLDELDEKSRVAFMNKILDAEPNGYDTSFREEMYKRTQGNPLFVTELVNLFRENGEIYRADNGVWKNVACLDWQLYPVRIEGIIRERIGKLEDSLVEMLSHASVQGNRFIVQILSKTMGESERTLLMDLSKKLQKQYHLVTEGECVRMKKNLVSRFYFSNYVFQQYLYHELSMTQRMLLHGDIAVILEDMYSDNPEDAASDIAYHFEMSGEYERAVKYMEIAAGEMMRISAYNQAMPILEKALTLLDEEIKEDCSLAQLRIMANLCICYYSVKGWGASETEQIYRQLEALRDRTGCKDYDEMIAFGLWTIHFVRLDFAKALAVMQPFMEVSRQCGNVVSWQTACVSVANTYFWMGDFTLTAKCLEEVKATMAEYPLTLQNHALYSLLRTNVLLLQGKEEESMHEREYMQREFTTVPDPFIQAMGWQVVAWHAFFNGETELCREAAARMLKISEKYSFSFYVGLGKIFVSGSLPAADYPEALKMADEGYNSLLQDKGAEYVLAHSLYKYIKATVFMRAACYKEGIKLLDETIPFCLKQGELCYLSHLYMLKGDCLHLAGDNANARNEYRKAWEAAEKQGICSLSKKAGLLFNQLKE